MLDILQSENYWDNTWENYFVHYQQDLRHAYYINALVSSQKMLEIGAGSFRDFAKLNELGVDCYAFDFCQNAVNKARDFFPDLSHKISQEDAFATSFQTNAFDFTFHNGFWGCFDNEQILVLAKEQIRISKNGFSFTLHNAHNIDFVNYFKQLSVKDPMYTVRFFSLDEIYAILDALNIAKNKLTVFPVGKGKKYYEDLLISQGIIDKESIASEIINAKMKYLNSSERLLCMVTM